MRYECLGGNSYKVILTLYRDCSGTSINASQFINITSSCSNQQASLNQIDLNPTDPNEMGMKDTSYLCEQFENMTTCDGGAYPGIEINKFEGFVSLPPCTDWTLTWESCCRNPAYSYPNTNACGMSYPSAYTRVVVPDAFGQRLVATLDNSTNGCNSSPIFNTTPRAFICQGQEINLEYGGVDPDGDLLQFSLIAPLNQIGTISPDTIQYENGYSSQKPISIIPGTDFNINLATGQMKIYPLSFDYNCYNPDSLEQSSMAVLVKEFRNGNLIGTTIRDIQIITIPGCEPIEPIFSGITNINSLQNYINDSTIIVCAGDSIIFDIVATDTVYTDSFHITSNFSDIIPNSTFSTVGSNPIIGYFEALPSNLDVGNFSFYIEASNNGCPIPITKRFNLYIEIVPSTVGKVSIDTTCAEQGDSLRLTVEGGSIFLWENLDGGDTWIECDTCRVTKAFPPHTTDYVITSNLDEVGCSNKDTVHVVRIPVIKPLENIDICYEDTAILQIEWDWSPSKSVKYEWNEDENLDDSLYETNVPGTYFYFVSDTADYTSLLTCEWKDTSEVSIIDCPIIIPNIFTPNGDSYNEVFEIKNIKNKTWNLSIYNRWGKKVFEVLDYQNDWKGEELADGTYYCILSNQDGGKITTIKNWFIIAR